MKNIDQVMAAVGELHRRVMNEQQLTRDEQSLMLNTCFELLRYVKAADAADSARVAWENDRRMVDAESALKEVHGMLQGSWLLRVKAADGA